MKWFYLSLLGFASVAAAKETAGDHANLPVPSQRFADLQTAEEPSFRRHVIPMFSRLGCSGRECHGAFSGQGGFQLSLFGYDFDHDHKEITSDPDEIRIDREHPEKSLVLQKPTMEVKHKGKERIKKGSWEYNLLLKWIQSGAKEDTEKTGDFDRLEVFPKEIVFKKAGESIQVRVLAYWKDGTVEDVTQLTRFRTNDESVSDVSDTGLVTSKEKGDTHIVAFYDNGVLPVQVMLPVSDQNGANYPKLATRTKVDELVADKLRKLGVVPSDVCSDAEFLRRVSLDVAGTLPTPEQVTRFMADKSPDKRATKIDELLKSPGYAAWWATKFCDIMGNNPRTLNGGAGKNYGVNYTRQWYDWVYRRVNENEPYDKFAAGIILATGRATPEQNYKEYALEMASYLRADHPADFSQRPNMPYFWMRTNLRKPEEKALAFSHAFLGVRIECAQCHKHPFDQWTKTDFAQFQAFFEPIAFGSAPGSKEEVNYQTVYRDFRETFKDAAPKEVKQKQDKEFQRRIDAGEVAPFGEIYVNNNRLKQGNPKQKKEQAAAGRVFTPKILGGEEVMLTQYNDPRVPLMDWLKSKDNPYFARAFVNRVWAGYFGRGIVEPADDMNLANPPVNKELMDYLADGFAAHNYDMRWVHREILASDAYQRSWQTNPSNKLDEKNFSHMVLRRLPAEVVLDAVTQATASTDKIASLASDLEGRAIGPNTGGYGKNPKGAKQGDNYTLGIFGKPVRETNCDCERTTDPTLLQTIYTRNDPDLLARVEGTKGREQSAWIAELRQAYSKAGASNEGEGIRKRVESLEAKFKGEQAPEKPADSDADAMNKYKVQLARHETRVAEFNKRKEELTAKLPKQAEPSAFEADKYISQVFLRTVSRPPTAQEIEKARTDIAAAKDPVDGVRDLLWAMLNTREFMVNH